MQNADNVTYAKPKIGGAVYVAPKGTALPTDTLSDLNAAFKSLGYTSVEGLRNENKKETDTIKAWGGDAVLILDKGKTDIYKFKLIEVLNVDVLKTVYGDENVTGALADGITIKANNTELPGKAFVFDMIMKNGVLKRVVVPDGNISEIGEISFVDNDAVGYDITLNALADASGNTHYEYTQG